MTAGERFCGNCGKAVSVTYRFCPYCGFDNTSGISQPVTPVPLQNSEPRRPYWTAGKILGLFLGLIILGGIAAFAYSQYHNVAQSGGLPIVQVTVAGTAQSVGYSTTPVRVEFGQCTYNNCAPCSFNGYAYSNCSQGCNATGEVCYTATHSAGVNNGQYSTILDNHSSWNVFLIYESLGIQSYCYAGSVTINSVSGTFAFDVRC